MKPDIHFQSATEKEIRKEKPQKEDIFRLNIKQAVTAMVFTGILCLPSELYADDHDHIGHVSLGGGVVFHEPSIEDLTPSGGEAELHMSFLPGDQEYFEYGFGLGAALLTEGRECHWEFHGDFGIGFIIPIKKFEIALELGSGPEISYESKMRRRGCQMNTRRKPNISFIFKPQIAFGYNPTENFGVSLYVSTHRKVWGEGVHHREWPASAGLKMTFTF
jgi:hypothetical protein